MKEFDQRFIKNINEIMVKKQEKQEKLEKVNNLIIQRNKQVKYKMGRAITNYIDNKYINIEPDNDLPPRPEKIPTCGTWFDECCNCCFVPLQCIGQCCSKSSECGKYIIINVKQLYFFALYLFTGELNKEAIGYKKYFNVTSSKDDQVNVPEIFITASSIVFELYKTLIGSFLTVFTAQRCGQQTCTIWENIIPKNDLELTGIIFNFLMATTLLIEYIFEIMREAYLIKYLKYDKSLANNGEHIAELYENSDKNIFTKLIPLYIIYIRFSYVVLLVYIVNVVLSATIVAGNYYDNTSIFSFVTNALFIIYKIYNVVEITSYRGDYFYSAYKRKNIHYNTIKPKYLCLPEIGLPENVIVDIEQPCEGCDAGEIAENIMIDIEEPRGVNNITENTISNTEPPHTELDIEQNIYSMFGIKYSDVKYSEPKNTSIILEDGEHLNEYEKEKVIQELYEKNYIDKTVYRKIGLFLRKSQYGEIELSNV